MAEPEKPVPPEQILSTKDLAGWSYNFVRRDPVTVELIDVSSHSAERVPDAIEIIERALDVIGSPERLARWMQMPIPALGESTPYSLIATEDGRERVATILGRIEHGIY